MTSLPTAMLAAVTGGLDCSDKPTFARPRGKGWIWRMGTVLHKERDCPQGYWVLPIK